MSLLISGGLLYWCSQRSAQEQQEWLVEWAAEGLIPTRNRRADAYHEIGHGLVGVVLGVEVSYISLERKITEDGIQNGCTSYRKTSKENEAIMLVAGKLANRISKAISSSDQDEARLKELFPDSQERVRVVRIAEEYALLIIEENGAALTELAELLMQQGRVEGSTVREIVEKHRRTEQAA